MFWVIEMTVDNELQEIASDRWLTTLWFETLEAEERVREFRWILLCFFGHSDHRLHHFSKIHFQRDIDQFKIPVVQGPLGVFSDRHGLLPDPRDAFWHAIHPIPEPS